MFEIRMLLQLLASQRVSDSATQRLVGGSGSRVSENERDERERTEKGNQVGSFLLKSHLFELIRLQTTHHLLMCTRQLNWPSNTC